MRLEFASVSLRAMPTSTDDATRRASGPMARLLCACLLGTAGCSSYSYSIVDTGQTSCYGTSGASTVSCPAVGASLNGQDAQYSGNTTLYVDYGNDTVADAITGLMWQKYPQKIRWTDVATSTALTGGYTDWRIPTIKELYSLINFSGSTGVADPSSTTAPADAIPYMDEKTFGEFAYGGGTTGVGTRYIDAQYISDTNYVSTTMNGSATFFGVNFADGRIKGYPTEAWMAASARRYWYLRRVRLGSSYGVNDLTQYSDNTIMDHATKLMWMTNDSGSYGAGDAADGSLDWSTALSWCENLSFAGYTDWRLPNAKELQSIVDYTRSPDTTSSAALDSRFSSTSITNEGGDSDFPYYWTSTTHLDGTEGNAVYVAFGRALGCYSTNYNSTTGACTDFWDVHGAGAQRSDPKSGSRSLYPQWGKGPQGDVRRVFNYARCVRQPSWTYIGPARAKHSEKCVDVSGASTGNGTKVQQWTCNGGNNQAWNMEQVSQSSTTTYYRIIAKHSGKCLDVSGASTASGANVHQWTCHGGDNQSWYLYKSSTINNVPYYQIAAKHSGKCLTVSGASTTNGTTLVQDTCTGAANQQFYNE